MKFTLKDYQEEAVKDVLVNLKKASRRWREDKDKRWDWVDFKYRLPTSDRRPESCRVWEDSIVVNGEMPPKDRAPFLNRLVSASDTVRPKPRRPVQYALE